MLRRGASISLATDWPVSLNRLIETIGVAATRQTSDGEPATARQAEILATFRDGAYIFAAASRNDLQELHRAQR
jgi:predicted amidohydrolase YtcJ